MPTKFLTVFAVSLLLLGGCAQNEPADYRAPEHGDPDYLKGKNTRADALYLNSSAPAGARDFRDVYIAPANLVHMQVVQPEGAQADDQWQVTDVEAEALQKVIVDEFSAALSYESAYNIVDSQENAEIVVHTTVVAIHPNATRSEIAQGGNAGGAITVSVALINAATGEVLVRTVDTRSSDDIWAFNQVENNDTAVTLIFRSWGNSMRRGVLQLQGRSSDPLAAPLTVKEQ